MFIILQGSTLYSKVFKNIRYIFSFCSKFLKQNLKKIACGATLFISSNFVNII